MILFKLWLGTSLLPRMGSPVNGLEEPFASQASIADRSEYAKSRSLIFMDSKKKVISKQNMQNTQQAKNVVMDHERCYLTVCVTIVGDDWIAHDFQSDGALVLVGDTVRMQWLLLLLLLAAVAGHV